MSYDVPQYLFSSETVKLTISVVFEEMNDTANAFPCMHNIECFIDLIQSEVMGDEFINLQFVIHVLINKFWNRVTTLVTSKSRSFPNSAGHQLEGSGTDLLASCSDTNDNRFSPTLVAGFQSRSHSVDVTNTFECIITSTISHLDQGLLCSFLRAVFGIETFCCTKFHCNWKFVWIDVNSNDPRCSCIFTSHNDS